MVCLICSCEKSEQSSEHRTTGKNSEPTQLEVKDKQSEILVEEKDKTQPEAAIEERVRKYPVAQIKRPVPNEVGYLEAGQLPYELVTNPKDYEVMGGGPGPVRGDKIYTYTILPKDACGTYWVKEENGQLSQMTLFKNNY